jgi:hypothetical protein
MYLPSVTELFFAQPPMYLMTGRGAPMQLAAEAALFRRLCDVHLKHVGAEVFIARRARGRHVERVEAACHSAEDSKGGKRILPSLKTVIRSTILLKYYYTTYRGWSVARMSNADRLRSGHGFPMSDRLVDIGPVERPTRA